MKLMVAVHICIIFFSGGKYLQMFKDLANWQSNEFPVD